MLSANRKKLQLWFEFSLLVGLVGVDQWLKWWFQMRDGVVLNRGGFLGVLPDFWWLWGLSVVWVGLLIHWWRSDWGWNRFGLLLILAGGLGNLGDRILFGSVRDFIYYPFFGFYGNVADIWLVLGVLVSLSVNLLLQYGSWMQTRQK